MNQPKYRRPLNDKQLTILNTIYRFRFVTSPLIAQLLNIKQSKAHERLNVLLEQEYIGRKYDKSYRLQGKAAAYYLMPKGAEVLAATGDEKYLSEVLRRLVKDGGRSDRFINHWLTVLDIYCRLPTSLADRLRFFTNTELVPYKAFIQPRPDAYIRLDKGAQERQFFLDYLDAAMPRFAMLGRIRQYIEYAENGEWEDSTKTKFPTVVLICETDALRRRLQRVAKDELEDSFEEDLRIVVAAREYSGLALDQGK